ncbi:MAG: hypothetical protein JJU12_03415 [Chlamydiales bacterium]|nr:hypothetical protein [Chlamydiales bacterium]
MKEKVAKALRIFQENGKEIEGVYDLLVRGGVVKEKGCVENWSDLDLSVIVEHISFRVHNQVKSLYREIKQIFPYKLSITCVSKADYLSPVHHHGIKPIYYTYHLSQARSLLKGAFPSYAPLSLERQQIDCLYHTSYLIHELRKKYLILEMDNSADTEAFLYYAIKRAKHYIRDVLFVLTGVSSEEIDCALFEEWFPEINPLFPDKLYKMKNLFPNLNKEASIEEILDTLERMHDLFLVKRNSGVRADDVDKSI